MADSTIGNLTAGAPAQATDLLPIQRGSSANFSLQVSDVLVAAKGGIYAAAYGVKGNGYIDFLAIFYEFALTQATISGSTVTYTGSVAPSSAISNIVETAGSVVTLTVASGHWGTGQSVNLSGLTTGTWLNGKTVTLLAGTTATSLIFNDPTSHGAQASHAEAGTATINFVGYSFTIAGFTNAGNNGKFTITSNTSTTLVCTNAGGVNETHAATAGSNTVDCSGQNFILNATVGQIVFGSTLQSGGFSTASTICLAQGTITAINSATQIVCSTAASASSYQTCLVWGDDESAALTSAWNAAVAATTMLVMPGINSNGNGPAVILVQSSQLCTTTNPSANGYGTGAMRSGYGACGAGINATYIVPTPNFSTASAVSNTCFLYTPDGANFHDFSIFGGGNGSPGSAYSSLIGAQILKINNAILQDMAFLAWGANQPNGLGIGLQIAGGEIVVKRVDCDMFGSVGCKTVNDSHLGYVTFSQCSFWDNGYINLWIIGTGTSSNNPVFTEACNFGNAACGVSVTAGGEWHDNGSKIGLASGVSYSTTPVGIGFAVTSAGNVQGAGVGYMIGTSVDSVLGSGGVQLLIDGTSSPNGLYLSGCIVNCRNSQELILNNGFLVDMGGNTFTTSGTLYSNSSTGKVYGALSITGVAQVSTNVALTNFGGSPTVTAVSGNTRLQQFTITVGSTPTGTATVVVTFPTPFLVAPIANLIQVGGNNALPGTSATFTPTTITSTSATFTYDGTLVGGDTLICQMTADLP